MMRMFGSDTRRALSSANSVVEALTDTTSALIEHAKDAAERNDDLSKTLATVIAERDRALAVADEAARLATDWRDKAFETLAESEIISNLLSDAEDDLTDTAFNFGVLLVEVKELLEVAPAGRVAAYVETRKRVAELVRVFDERDRDAVEALVAKYEVAPEDETSDEDE